MSMSFTLPFTTSEWHIWHNRSKTKSASAVLICTAWILLKCPVDTLLLRHDQRIFWNCTDGLRPVLQDHTKSSFNPSNVSLKQVDIVHWNEPEKNRGLEVPKLFRALWASAVQSTSLKHVACSVDIAWDRLALFSLNKMICVNTKKMRHRFGRGAQKTSKFKACRTRFMSDSKNWSFNDKDIIMSERLVLSCCVWNSTHVLWVTHQRSMIKVF